MFPDFFHSEIGVSFVRFGEQLNIGKRSCRIGEKNVLVSWAAVTKNHKPGGLGTTELYPLTVLESTDLKLGCQ